MGPKANLRTYRLRQAGALASRNLAKWSLTGHLLPMSKSKATSDGLNQRSSATGRFVKVKSAESAPKAVVAETGGFKVRNSSSGGTVVGRNAVTGQFVLAPAIKAGSTFRKMKTNAVREVIRDKRGT